MNKEIIDGKEYRLVAIRNRSKLIAKDGQAINPIRRKQKCTIHYNEDGYPCFGGGIPVHQYVALGWVDGYFEGAEVDHKDFDRTNYHADNLEWKTHNSNVKHSADDGHYRCHDGVKNGRCVPVDVFDLCDNLVKHFDYLSECAKWMIENGTSRGKTVSGVVDGICKRIADGKPYFNQFIIKYSNDVNPQPIL